MLAYKQNKIELHSSIWIRIKSDENKFKSNFIKKIKLHDETTIEYYENLQIRKGKDDRTIVQYLRTTTGRVILNYTIQKTLNFL